MMRELRRAVKDQSYTSCSIGAEVARYLRTLRYANAAKNTLEAKELVLARLALEHADFEGVHIFASHVGTEYLREFLDDQWGDSSPATRAQRLSIVKSFFQWEVGEGRIEFNPAAAIKGPRVRSPERPAHARDTIVRLISAQESLRDQCALGLLGRMALRKDELRQLRLGDIDLLRYFVTVHGKGDKVSLLPLAFEDLRADLTLYVGAERAYAHDEYLLYPRSQRRRPMDPSSVHRWFKRCLERAGLPTSIQMHELRHSAAHELFSVTGNIVLAQMLLRHESVGTTQVYLHPTREDLAAGMRAVDAAWAVR